MFFSFDKIMSDTNQLLYDCRLSYPLLEIVPRTLTPGQCMFSSSTLKLPLIPLPLSQYSKYLIVLTHYDVPYLVKTSLSKTSFSYLEWVGVGLIKYPFFLSYIGCIYNYTVVCVSSRSLIRLWLSFCDYSPHYETENGFST